MHPVMTSTENAPSAMPSSISLLQINTKKLKHKTSASWISRLLNTNPDIILFTLQYAIIWYRSSDQTITVTIDWTFRQRSWELGNGNWIKCTEVAITGPFFNPGILGLENSYSGISGFNPGIETACKSGSIVCLTLGLRKGGPPVFINGIFPHESFGIFFVYLWASYFWKFWTANI